MMRLRRRRRDERGAVAVLVVVLSTALLMIAALVVDIGMQRVGRADMQALADVVAMDLARQIDGQTVGQLEPIEQSLANASRDRNESVVDYDDHKPKLDVTWGEMGEDKEFHAITDSSVVPTAVKVRADTEVGFAFSGITQVATGGANRDAVASSEDSACIRLGSFIAGLKSSEGTLLNPLLGTLLGSDVNLGIGSYQGLATSNISLADLVEVGGLGVGSVDELLALDNVSAASMFVAAANVLQKQGKLAEADLLRAIKVGVDTPAINIADLIEAAPGDPAALAADINALDLVTGTALIANKDHAVSIPNLGIDLSPLAQVNTTLTVIEAPRMTCKKEGGVAKTAQVKLDIEATIPGRTIDVNILGLAGVKVTVDPGTVKLSIDVGQARAKLLSVNCPTADGLKVALSSSVVGAIDLRADVGAHATFSVPLLGSGGLLSQLLSVLGLGSLLNPPEIVLNTGVALRSSAPPTGDYNKVVPVPVPGAYTVPAGSGSGTILAPTTASVAGTTNMTIKYGLLGTNSKAVLSADQLYSTVLNPVLGAVAASLNPLLTKVQQAILTPLSDMLGLQVGGADVFAVPTPECGGVRLVQ